MKRNWDETAKILDTFLAKTNNATQNKKQKTNKPTPYKFNNYNIILKRMDNFLKNEIVNENETTIKCYHLRNNISGKDIRINLNNALTIGMLKRTFSQDGGHCFAFNFMKTYSTQLMFDLDCRKCKEGTCTAELETEMIDKLIFSDVCYFLETELQLQDVRNKGVVFKKDNCCNLHIYFDISVSIILFELLRKKLPNHLSELVLDQYLIDNITCLDLPYSSKDGINIYKEIIFPDGFESISCLPNIEFYDVKLNMSINQLYNNCINLGSFTIRETNWQNDETVTVKHIYIEEDSAIIKVKNVNNLLVNIKLSKTTFNTPYTLLKSYMQVTNENMMNHLTNVEIYQVTKNINDKIYTCLQELGNQVLKYVFKLEYVDRSISYLLSFITVNECSNLFYGLCVIILYCYKFSENIDLESCKKEVLKILLSIHKRNESDNKILEHIVYQFDKYNCMVFLESTFTNTNEWLSYFTYLYKLSTLNDMNISENEKWMKLIILQLKKYDTLDSLLYDLVEYCKLTFPLKKLNSSKKYFYYKNGQYEVITEDKFLSRNDILTQTVELRIKTLITELANSSQINEELIDKPEKIIKIVWLKYLDSLNGTDIKFNVYDYFICTEYGIFNTITGLYMEYTPLLFFTTAKQYCTVPIIIKNLEPEITISKLNRYLMFQLQSQLYNNVLTFLFEEQFKLFYCTIMIPGLMTLDSCFYSEKQEHKICMELYKYIIHDKSDVNMKLLYFTECIIAKYKLNVNTLLELGGLIGKNSKFSRKHIHSHCQFENYTKKTVKPFVQEKDITLYDQLLKVTSFNPKTFALAAIIACFELTAFDKCLTEYFDFTVDKSITLSVNNIFYDYETQNFSIKTYENTKRLMFYMLPQDEYISDELITLVYTISGMLNFNEVLIKDFVACFSMIYNHNADRKKLILLLGCPKSGKSTFQKIMLEIHGKSVHSINNLVQSNNVGPAPEFINMLSNYLFNISELQAINANTIKALIGSDAVHKRLLFQNEMQMLKPIAFSVGASNKIPHIHGADEAVRDRLAPFPFKKVLDEPKNIEEGINDNALISYLLHENLIANMQLNLKKLSKDFSNLLYEFYSTHVNDENKLNLELNSQNTVTNKLIQRILEKNNIIYELIHKSRLELKGETFMSFATLEAKIEPSIALINKQRNKTYTWDYIKNEMIIMFKHLEEENGLRGIRDINHSFNTLSVDILTYSKNSSVSESEILKYMYHIKKIEVKELKTNLKELLIHYKIFHDANNKCIKDHVLNHEG
ncbi:helicase [Macrobrachium rosenbergii nudivirus]|nr:helicase [Macrobrachium rosenbergii nudivirus]